MLFCDICGMQNNKDNIYCIHCGNFIALKNICPKCDTTNADATTKCIKCGYKLDPIVFSSFNPLFSMETRNKLKNNNLSSLDYYSLIKDIFFKYNFTYDSRTNIKNNIIVLANNFATCKAKSRGSDYGYSFGKVIFYDDRLDASNQIAAILHELAHIILGTILNEYICCILEIKNSIIIESFVWYCFNSNDKMKILSEYCAHTVEGRFLPYGYQNYKSFNELISETSLSIEEINEVMILGNSYANEIIVFLEKFLTEKLRDSIKTQYKIDQNKVNYESITLETDISYEIGQKNIKINDILLSIMDNIDYDELLFIKKGFEEIV